MFDDDDGSTLPPHSYDGGDASRWAAQMAGAGAAAQRTIIFEFIHSRGRTGATCDEVEVAFGMLHQAASARIYELRGKYRKLKMPAVVFQSGRFRPTRRGSPANVNVTKEFV